MIAVDTSVLVAAHRRAAPAHDRAVATILALCGSRRPWAIPWPCVHEFLAVVTHPRILDPPSTIAQASAQVDAWCSVESLVLIGEAAAHRERLHGLLGSGAAAGPRVHDARIAAICLDHGVSELLTADRDFGRFPALRTRNPLVG